MTISQAVIKLENLRPRGKDLAKRVGLMEKGLIKKIKKDLVLFH